MKQQNENEESNAVSVSVQSDRTFLATEPIGKLLAKQNRGVQFDRKHMTAPFECNILIHFVILCYYYISLQIEFQ